MGEEGRGVYQGIIHNFMAHIFKEGDRHLKEGAQKSKVVQRHSMLL